MFTFPATTSARDIQRNYRQLFNRVNKTGKPLLVMRNNKPDVAVIGIKKFEQYQAIDSVLRSLNQAKQGKAKLLKSLQNL